MRQFIAPVQDTSIYEKYPTRNTGYDEILEVGKTGVVSGSVRSLIQFDVSAFDGVPAETIYLNLRVAHMCDAQHNQSIELYQVGEEWDEGTGFYEQDLKNAKDGATWKIKDNTDAEWTNPGGTTGSLIATYTFGWEPVDVRLDITDVVREWVSGSTNNGILIKLPDADEDNNKVLANIRYFSRNTHTIYPSTIEAIWYDRTMDVPASSGLTQAPDEIENFVINQSPTYALDSTHRIRFGARPATMIKSFADTFRYGNQYFHGSSSHIGIMDTAAKDMVIPFDDGSLLSADGVGSYYDLKIENMYIGRTYSILLKLQKDWGDEIIDTGHTFTVTA